MGDHEAEDDDNAVIFSSSVYDILKFIAQIFLPAVGTLYFTIAQVWGLPAAEQTIGTITAVDAFMGVILGISSAAYNRSDAKYVGNMVVEHNTETGKKVVSLEVNGDPHEIANRKEVTFRVKTP